MIGSGTLIMVAGVAAFAAALFYPAVGLLVLCFVGPLKPPPVIPAPGFNMILVGLILLGCVYQLPTNRTRLFVSRPLLLLFAYVAYVFAQQVPDMAVGYAGDGPHDVGYLFFNLLTGLGALVAGGFVLRGRSPYPFLFVLLLSATFAGILGIVTAQGITGFANLVPVAAIADRASGPFGNPNNYGQFLAYGMVLALGCFAITRSTRLRVGLAVAVSIMGIAVLLSLSRGALATLLAGMVVFAFARSRALGLTALSAALALVIIGYPLFVESRLVTEVGSASAEAAKGLELSDEGRLSAVLAGPELFATSPIFGIGFGQYKFMSALVSEQGAGLVAHNWYGTVLAEQGLLGLGLWLAMLVAVGSWLRSRPPRPRSIGLAMLGAGIVGCMFLQPPTTFQISVLPIIVITAALVGDWDGLFETSGGERLKMPSGASHEAAQVRPMEPMGRGVGA